MYMVGLGMERNEVGELSWAFIDKHNINKEATQIFTTTSQLYKSYKIHTTSFQFEY